MTKVDLITGFLGAGKTTFLLKYARYLMSRGLKLGIMEYDYGAVNIDMPLLNELRGEKCELEMLSGACCADTHRRRFHTKLISMAMSGYDRIIIEPSGIFDMDEFFDALNESPLDRWLEPGSIITIVDSCLEDDFSRQADFLLASQCAYAGRIVLSKTQFSTAVSLPNTKDHLKKASALINCPAPPDRIFITKNWDEFTSEDFEELAGCGYRMNDYIKLSFGEIPEFSSLAYLNLSLSIDVFKDKISLLFNNSEYGNILRIKGFFPDGERWYQVNATRQKTDIQFIPPSHSAVIVIGSNLNDEKISALFDSKAY